MLQVYFLKYFKFSWTTTGVLFWLLILSSAVIHVRLNLFGVNTQLAIFDFVVPLIFLWACYTRKIKRIPKKVWLTASAIVITLIFHSTCIYIFKDNLQFVWLLKETLKLVVIVLEYSMLLVIFQARGADLPPQSVSFFVFVVSILVVSGLAYYYFTSDPDLGYKFTAPTVYSVALLGLLFFIIADASWLYSTRRRILAIIASIVVAFIGILLLNKGVTGIALATGVWITFGGIFRRLTSYRVGVIACGLLLVTGLGMYVAKVVGMQVEFLERIDGIERSVSVRLSLWALALESFGPNFPLGIGLGQFWELVVKDISIAVEGHRYIHSTFVGFVVELGILGILLLLGLWVVICAATQGWPSVVRPIFLLLVIIPLAIHDGHSIRMLVLAASLGLARSLHPSCKAKPD